MRVIIDGGEKIASSFLTSLMKWQIELWEEVGGTVENDSLRKKK